MKVEVAGLYIINSPYGLCRRTVNSPYGLCGDKVALEEVALHPLRPLFKDYYSIRGAGGGGGTSTSTFTQQKNKTEQTNKKHLQANI